MIDDTFCDALAADQYAMIAQDHEGTAIEIADYFWRHVVIEFEAFECVIFNLAIKSQRMLIDRPVSDPQAPTSKRDRTFDAQRDGGLGNHSRRPLNNSRVDGVTRQSDQSSPSVLRFNSLSPP